MTTIKSEAIITFMSTESTPTVIDINSFRARRTEIRPGKKIDIFNRSRVIPLIEAGKELARTKKRRAHIAMRHGDEKAAINMNVRRNNILLHIARITRHKITMEKPNHIPVST